jgi:hypothetical protein
VQKLGFRLWAPPDVRSELVDGLLHLRDRNPRIAHPNSALGVANEAHEENEPEDARQDGLPTSVPDRAAQTTASPFPRKSDSFSSSSSPSHPFPSLNHLVQL